jgi:Na+/H+ antiporter NhaD/arsenite permease-like protein
MPPVPLAWSLPFAGLLLAIATAPLVAGRWWEVNRHKALVAAAFAAPVAVWAAVLMPDVLGRVFAEYAGFLTYLGALYTISGGISVEGDLRATPRVNTAFLAAGALLANVAGTTGASMLLVRPLLRTNRQRRNVVHTVVFFIFVVCNTGGCLTPLGDPPLFVGWLRGVPFAWTLRLWPAWLGVNAALLAVYAVVETVAYRRETTASLLADEREAVPLSLRGKGNLVPLAAAVACVLWLPAGWREAALVLLAAFSYRLTPAAVRLGNGFTWAPIVEVGVLFAGIFVTMIPALVWLNRNAASLGVDSPAGFFWATGALSSVLDNTPTYLAFLSVARGLPGPDEVAGTSHATLTAIALGAVLFGAATYVGNGPNFMVRAVAEASGVKLPSFFGYLRWSLAILVPLFFVTSLLLFQGIPPR